MGPVIPSALPAIPCSLDPFLLPFPLPLSPFPFLLPLPVPFRPDHYSFPATPRKIETTRCDLNVLYPNWLLSRFECFPLLTFSCLRLLSFPPTPPSASFRCLLLLFPPPPLPSQSSPHPHPIHLVFLLLLFPCLQSAIISKKIDVTQVGNFAPGHLV